MRARVLCVAAMVFAAAALGGSADALGAAATLDLTVPEEGGRSLAPGNLVEYEGYDQIFESTSGSATCSQSGYHNGFYGKDQTNDEKTDRLSLEAARGTYDGGACSGSFPTGPGTVVYWYATSGQEIGTLALSAAGKAEFKSSAASDTRIELDNASSEQYCVYSVKKLKGTAAYKAKLAVSVVISEQKLKLLASHDVDCPKTVKLSFDGELYTAPPGSEQESRHEGTETIQGSVS